MHAETKAKIDKYVRKHRKSGGRAEEGRDDADMDLKDNPEDRTAPNKVAKEAEAKEAKKGGRVKKACGGMAEKKEVGLAEGGRAHHHAGRRHRASGGGCEANPFSSAMRGTSTSGCKTMHESQGMND